MPTTRTKQELEALRAEAEKRVRAGESRSEVARALGVAVTTLSQWALRYRWRRKDIEAETGEDAARKVEQQIAALRAHEAAAGEAATQKLVEGIGRLEAALVGMREAAAQAKAEAGSGGEATPVWKEEWAYTEKDPYREERIAALKRLEDEIDEIERVEEEEEREAEETESRTWNEMIDSGVCPYCSNAVDPSKYERRPEGPGSAAREEGVAETVDEAANGMEARR